MTFWRLAVYRSIDNYTDINTIDILLPKWCTNTPTNYLCHRESVTPMDNAILCLSQIRNRCYWQFVLTVMILNGNDSEFRIWKSSRLLENYKNVVEYSLFGLIDTISNSYISVVRSGHVVGDSHNLCNRHCLRSRIRDLNLKIIMTKYN